jgi:hypothetical protein
LISITGKVEGTFVTAKTSDGLTNITANFDTTSGQITNGFWKDTKPNPDNNVTYEGFFNGYGCKLN